MSDEKVRLPNPEVNPKVIFPRGKKTSTREEIMRNRKAYESQFHGVLSTAAREGMVITMWELLAFLAVLVSASGIGFGAGMAWRERETRHLITVQEVTEIQDGMREDIGELWVWRMEVDNRLEALQACANAAGWGRVEKAEGRRQQAEVKRKTGRDD
jgi:hypothetical protein